MTPANTRNHERGTAAIALIAIPLIVVTLILILLAAVGASQAADSTGCAGDPVNANDPGNANTLAGVHLDGEQLANATIIVDVAASLHLPPHAAQIALAVALQESSLRDLGYGDRDSLGLFQQRAAWGSVTARTTPTTAATMFYTGGHGGQPGLVDIPGWASRPLTVAGQAVQVSVTPNAYDTWSGPAAALVGQLWPAANSSSATFPPASSAAPPNSSTACPRQDGDGSSGTEPGTTTVPAGLVVTGSSAGQTAARFALAQLGKPYQWGAAGPASYDCSGLTMTAWKQSGQPLPHFTGAQVRHGTPVTGGLNGAVGGDLVFIPGTDGTIAYPRHVGMVVGYIENGGRTHLWIVHAPHTGAPVQLVDAATWAGQIAAVRHIA